MNASIPTGHIPIKVKDVPKYLRDHFLLEVSRQTVYNWMNFGKRKETLNYARIATPAGHRFKYIQFTTHEWIIDFLHRSGLHEG